MCRRLKVRVAAAMDTFQPMHSPCPHQGSRPHWSDTRLSQQHHSVAAPGSRGSLGIRPVLVLPMGMVPPGASGCPFGSRELSGSKDMGAGGQGSLPLCLAKLIIMANMPQICLLRSPHCSFNQKLLSNYILLFLCLCVNHFPGELVFNCCLICIIMHINLHT